MAPAPPSRKEMPPAMRDELFDVLVVMFVPQLARRLRPGTQNRIVERVVEVPKVFSELLAVARD